MELKECKKELGLIEIQLGMDELSIIHQCLNEVCNGMAIFEFQTRIGVPKEEVLKLLKTTDQILFEHELSK